MPARLRTVVVAVLAALIPASAVEAQNGNAAAPIAIRESVVVTATGRETPESKIGATVTVLESETIEQRNALSTIDLLQLVPGVVAVRSGGVGNLTGVFVRGGESTYNKVLLDGIPLNEPGGSFNFASLSPENIERVEVMRGAHSALFGSDAMASVIQLFSIRPEAGRPQARVTADGGSYNTAHVAAVVGARNNNLEYSVSGSYLNTDNREPNNENTTSTALGTVTRSFASGASLRFIGRGEWAKTGVPGPTAFGPADMDASFKHGDGSFLSAWNQSLSSRVTHQASYSYNVTNQRSTNLIEDPSYVPQFGDLVAMFPSFEFLYDSETRLARHHLAYRLDAGLSGSQILTAAVEVDGERGRQIDHLESTTRHPGRRNVGTTLQYEAGVERLTFVGGVRFENNGSFGFYAAPRASVSWLASSGSDTFGATRLRGSAGLGIKEPTFLQSYSPSPGFFGNPDLAPEKSRGFDVSIEQRLARDRVALEATYFSNHFDDLISLGPSDPVTFNARYENIGETRASGIELGGTSVVAGALRFSGAYTFLDSKVITSTSSSPIFAAGQPLYRRPRHTGSVQASYSRQRAGLALTGVFVGSRVDTDFNFPSVRSNSGYATWQVSGDVRLAPRASAFINIENLADRQYMEPLGYPGLGRSVRAGVKTSF